MVHRGDHTVGMECNTYKYVHVCPFYTTLSPFGGRILRTNRYFPVHSRLFKVLDDGKLTTLAKQMNYRARTQANVYIRDGYAYAKIPIFAGQEVLGPSCRDLVHAC